MNGLFVVNYRNYRHSINEWQAVEYLAIMRSFTNSFLFFGHL